jgi:Rrf2 family transcriptional repressor of oqxAB
MEVSFMNAKIPAVSGWFRMAVQELVVLAETGTTCSSAVLARDLNAHAVFLRRVTAQLVQARIVVAREGRDGGYRLARPADCITLAEVYQAIKAAELPEADISSRDGNISILQALDEVAAEAEQSLLQVLNRHTIASMMKRSTTITSR